MVLPWCSAAAAREGVLGAVFYDRREGCDERLLFQSQLKGGSRLLFTEPVMIQAASPAYSPDTSVKYRSIASKELVDKMAKNMVADVPSLSFAEGDVNMLLRETLDAEEFRAKSMDYGRNKLVAISNPLLADSTTFIYAQDHTLRIQTVNEIDIDNSSIGLVESESASIACSDTLTQVQAGSSVVTAASTQSVHIFKWTDSGDLVPAGVQSFHHENIKFFAMNPTGLELAVIAGTSSDLIISDGASKKSIRVRSGFSSCAFMSSSGVVALAGSSPSIELVDGRGVAAGLRVSDTESPFLSVHSFAPHQNDINLLAASCKVESEDAELRVYDIRYPKEATIRIHSAQPHYSVQFGHLIGGSNLTDDIIGVDGSGQMLHYALERDGGNQAAFDWDRSGLGFSMLEALSPGRNPRDGESPFSAYSPRHLQDSSVLSLAHISSIPNGCHSSLHLGQFKDPFLSGICVKRSSTKADCSLLATLSHSGKLSCRFISYNSVPSELQVSPLNEPSIGTICDYSHLAQAGGTEEFENDLSAAWEPTEDNFAPVKGAARYLDFYWDEQKAKIMSRAN